MKTIKFFSALILTMIFAGMNTVHPDNVPTDKPHMSATNNIRYEVNVLLFARIELCNTYIVEVTDETGRPVAPPKIYIPGIQKYIFTETGPAQGKLRVAQLILSPNVDPIECQIHLGARPDVKIGPFMKGQSYPFILRPILTAPLNQ
jgi:hypothetical protein